MSLLRFFLKLIIYIFFWGGAGLLNSFMSIFVSWAKLLIDFLFSSPRLNHIQPFPPCPSPRFTSHTLAPHCCPSPSPQSPAQKSPCCRPEAQAQTGASGPQVLLIWTPILSTKVLLILQSSVTKPPDSRKLVPTFQNMKHRQLHSLAIRLDSHVRLSAKAPPSRH